MCIAHRISCLTLLVLLARINVEETALFRLFPPASLLVAHLGLNPVRVRVRVRARVRVRGLG